MNIFITGIAGMLGTSLAQHLTLLGHEIYGIDNFQRGVESNLDVIRGFNRKTQFQKVDCRISYELLKIKKFLPEIDVIIHLADVVGGVDYAFNNQWDIFRDNTTINNNIADLTLILKPKLFIYAGTACSYPHFMQCGSQSYLKEKDLFPAQPESSYGWSKLTGTLTYRFALTNTNIRYCTALFHNLYGPYCDLNETSSQVIPSLLKKIALAKNGSTISVWGNGNQSRSFLHVKDACKAIEKLINYQYNPPEVIQISSLHATSIKKLAQKCVQISKKNIKINFDTSKPTGDYGRAADLTLLKEVFNWVPSITLEDGLSELYRWISGEI